MGLGIVQNILQTQPDPIQPQRLHILGVAYLVDLHKVGIQCRLVGSKPGFHIAAQQFLSVKGKVELPLFTLQQQIFIQCALDGRHQGDGRQPGNAGHVLLTGLAADAIR